MEIILSFLISVMAEVVGYFICKWLDGHESDNQPKLKTRSCSSWFFVPIWTYIIISWLISLYQDLRYFQLDFVYKFMFAREACLPEPTGFRAALDHSVGLLYAPGFSLSLRCEALRTGPQLRHQAYQPSVSQMGLGIDMSRAGLFRASLDHSVGLLYAPEGRASYL